MLPQTQGEMHPCISDSPGTAATTQRRRRRRSTTTPSSSTTTSSPSACLFLLVTWLCALASTPTTWAFIVPAPSSRAGQAGHANPVVAGARTRISNSIPSTTSVSLQAGRNYYNNNNNEKNNTPKPPKPKLSNKSKRKEKILRGMALSGMPEPPPSPPPTESPIGILYEGSEEDDEEHDNLQDDEEIDAEILEFNQLMDKGAFQLLDEDDVEIDENYDGFDSEDEEEEDEDEDDEEAKKVKNDPEWQFFDTAKVYVKGGDGGDGCVAFRREKFVDMGGPNGGSGGHGGSVYLKCEEGLNTLAGLRSKVHWKAGDGGRGQGKSRTGASAPDIVIDVPPGTIVRTQDGTLAGQLVEHGQKVLVARGGRGGRGNEAFKSERNNAPKLLEKGEPGPERWLSVELKLVADVGFVGVPNAGKSTLLAAVSNARPKIADYPFTTIVPNLGVWDASEAVQGEWVEKGMVLADIPGLLEGAHQGVGLGLAFLRHVQRCRVLVHVVNGDSPDPVGDYVAINQELLLFNPKLAEKPQVVVLNKIDLPGVAERQAEIEQALKEVIPHTRFMSISAIKKENTGELMHRVWKMLRVMKVEEEDLLQGEVPVQLDEENFRMSYQVITDPKFPGQFRIQGKQIEKICAMTNWDYYEAVERFQRIMDATGINKTLKKRGAKEGDLIMIGEKDFDYSGSSNVYAAANMMEYAREHYDDPDAPDNFGSK